MLFQNKLSSKAGQHIFVDFGSDSMAIHLNFLTAIELFQHCNKYADHKIFHDAFEGSL